MKTPSFLALSAILISGCVATMKGQYEPAQDMNVIWLGRDVDKVGIASVTGDGDPDGHFRVELSLGQDENVESIGIFQTDPSGVHHFGHGVWHTSTTAGLNWIVGVFKDGEQLNKQHVASLGKFSGRATFDLYFSENNWVGHMQEGHHFVVEVAHGGVTSKKLITLGRRETVARAATTSVPEVDEAAAKKAEAARLEKLKQLEEFYDSAMENGARSEVAADYRTAAKHYQKAVSVSQNLTDKSKEQDARSKVIETILSLDVAPAIPEEARRLAIRGEAIMHSAKKLADFKRAASEFEEASVLTPWWGSVYYNLGLAREASMDAKGAIRAFELFLKAEPNAPEAQAIKDRLYALEIPAEEQTRKEAFVGTWKSGSGSILKAVFLDDQFHLTEVTPSPSAAANGYYAGQVVLNGKWDGTQIVGKMQTSHTSGDAHPRFSACFGKFGAYSGVATLKSPDELTFKYNDYWITRFNTDTCEVLQREVIRFTNTFVR